MKLSFRYLLIGLASGIFSHANLFGQSDITNFLQAGEQDASKLMSAYLDPVVVGLSYGLNGGWYHTAKAHKTLGFDLDITFNAVLVPESNSTFRPADLNLSVTTLINPQDGIVPTLVGPDKSSQYEVDLSTDQGTQTIQFNGPPGLDFEKWIKLNAVPAPMVQLGVGVYKNTDLKIRFIPEQKVGDAHIRMMGLGVMHDIKQHIPGIRLVPFDLSVLVGYTRIDGDVGMESIFSKPSGDTERQEMVYEMNAWTFQAIISKKLGIVTFYGGAGYNTINSSSEVFGSYIIFEGNDPSSDVVLTDPVSLSFKNQSFRFTAGVRFKFGPFYLHGDYSFQEYNTAAVGLGFSFR
jgi:hypothetical protein